MTRRGRRSKKFTISTPPKEKGRSFPFYKTVVEGGNWLHLTPSAQALYPVMRYFGYFDLQLFEMDEEAEEYVSSDFDEFYPNRTWDFCEAELSILAEYAGVTRRSAFSALENLEQHCVIGKSSFEEFPGWKVFLHPPSYYKRAYLNKKINDKYLHLKTA